MQEDLIIRSKYHQSLLPYIGKQLIKVITGQRRVGKSYIMKQTMMHISKADPAANIIYINKEDLSFAAIKTATDLDEYIRNNKKRV